MKKLKIIYWIITAVFRLPVYFLFFMGLTKLLGIIALFIPGFPKVKEWVYAGFTFDLVGAIYSTLAVGDVSILFYLKRTG